MRHAGRGDRLRHIADWRVWVRMVVVVAAVGITAGCGAPAPSFTDPDRLQHARLAVGQGAKPAAEAAGLGARE